MTRRSVIGGWRVLLAGATVITLAVGCRSTAVDRSVHQPIRNNSARQSLTVHKGDLTLEQAITRAVACSEAVALQKARVNDATREWYRTADQRDPEFRFTGGGGTSDSVERGALSPAETSSGEGNDYRARFRVFPPNPWQRSASVSAAKAVMLAAQAELRAAEQRVAADVRRLFAETLHAEKELELLRRLLRVYKAIRNVTKAQLARGEAVLSDDVAATRAYLSSLSDLHRAERAAIAARTSLATLACVPVAELRLADDGADTLAAEKMLRGLGVLPGGGAVGAGIEAERIEMEALGRRADLAALRWHAVAAGAAYREARSARIPWFTYVEASYGWGSDSRDRLQPPADASVEESESEEWQLTLGMSVPILPWLSDTPAACRTAWLAAKSRSKTATMHAFTEIRNAAGALREIARQKARYEKEAEPVLREMGDRLLKVKDEQGIPMDERLRICEQLLLSRQLKLQTDFDHQLAIIELLRVLGIEHVRR